MIFFKNSQAEDFAVRSTRLCVPISIVANATPASKTSSSGLPGCCVLSLQGETATAAAIDSGCNFATPQDAASAVFGVLLYNLGTTATLAGVTTSPALTSSGTITCAANGASSSGVTASGNIAVSLTWSGSLATTNLSTVLHVDLITAKA